nr:hypothetical protein [Tanacetum cinerariifolium]
MIAYLEKTENNSKFHQIVDFLTSSSIHHSLTDATTASLDVHQDSNNITKTQSKAILNEPTPWGEGSCSGPRHQETIGGVMAQIISEGALSPLIHLSQQANEIASLKKRVTKLEQRQSSRILGFHPFKAGTSKRHSLGRRKVYKQGRKNLKSQQMFQDIDDVLDEDANIEMIVEDKGNGEKGGSTTKTVSTARQDISAARLEVSTVEPKTPPTTTTLFDDEDDTISDTLLKMKNHKAKEKGIVFKDADDYARPIRSITILQPLPTIDPKDKGSEEDEKRIGSRKKRAADDDKAIDYETLDVKSPIIGCESQVLGTNEAGDVHVYKLTRLDGSYRHFLTFSRMLEVPDRQDVLDLHKIIMERFLDNDPEGYDLILWGDLKTLVELSKDDEIWKNQQDWRLLSWKLYETCGVYTLMLYDSLVSVNMFIEKRYPLTKEILKNMLSLRLEAKTESTLALDLIKFIKLKIEEK